MNDTAILLDSTTSLPDGYAAAHAITTIPVPIYAAGREYRDGIDLDEEGFLRLLETSRDRPSTAVPGIGEFVSWYERVLQGHRNVIYPIASRHLSGLFNAAVLAAHGVEEASVVAIDPPEGLQENLVAVYASAGDMERQLERIAHLPSRVIVVMNTDLVSGGVGLITMRGIEGIEDRAPLDQVLRAMIETKSSTQLYFILNTLDYVVDRVGHLQAFLGGVLKIRPVMAIQNGLVEDVAKVRGQAKSRMRMLELVKQQAGDRSIDVMVLHSLAPDEARELQSQVLASLNVHKSWITRIGCTVSRFTGRGGLGIVFAEA